MRKEAKQIIFITGYESRVEYSGQQSIWLVLAAQRASRERTAVKMLLKLALCLTKFACFAVTWVPLPPHLPSAQLCCENLVTWSNSDLSFHCTAQNPMSKPSADPCVNMEANHQALGPRKPGQWDAQQSRPMLKGSVGRSATLAKSAGHASNGEMAFCAINLGFRHRIIVYICFMALKCIFYNLCRREKQLIWERIRGVEDEWCKTECAIELFNREEQWTVSSEQLSTECATDRALEQWWQRLSWLSKMCLSLGLTHHTSHVVIAFVTRQTFFYLEVVLLFSDSSYGKDFAHRMNSRVKLRVLFETNFSTQVRSFSSVTLRIGPQKSLKVKSFTAIISLVNFLSLYMTKVNTIFISNWLSICNHCYRCLFASICTQRAENRWSPLSSTVVNCHHRHHCHHCPRPTQMPTNRWPTNSLGNAFNAETRVTSLTWLTAEHCRPLLAQTESTRPLLLERMAKSVMILVCVRIALFHSNHINWVSLLWFGSCSASVNDYDQCMPSGKQ